MFQRTFIKGLVAALALTSVTFAPMTASAQSSSTQHRQKTKNDWRNLSIGSAAVGLYGLLKHDNTLMFLGAAGALYSVNRYEQDRKSQNKAKRARAEMFQRKSFTRDGHRYVRQTVRKNGKTYYQFVRAK
jgi:Ni/Co efflux regulator RcnB